MVTHYFSLPASVTSIVDYHFDTIFLSSGASTKEHLPVKKLYDKTTEFQNPSNSTPKITLTSSDAGVLRMISHALSLQSNKFTISFVGESAKRDPQVSYFMDNTKKNIRLKNFLSEQIHLGFKDHHSPLDYRLGSLQQDIASSRCYLADSTFLFFNINALKWSDSPAQSGSNPSGLTSEQANQLAFMAGQSHKNKFLILYGFENFDRDPYGISLNSAIQILWYYQYGAMEKPQPWPIPDDRQQDFTIESTMATNSLVFRKDRITNNWFHKIPFDLPPDLANHQWISSSYDEYLATANEDLPLRLLEWYDLIDHQ